MGVFSEVGFGRERAVVARLESGLAVVPFAIPVATPVAVVQAGNVVYAYAPPGAADDAKLRAEFEAFRRWRQAQVGTPANASAHANHIDNDKSPANADVASKEVARGALVATHCLRCHSGPQAKGNMRVDGTMSSEARLAAIRAVLAGDMPKGTTLAEDVLGELLYELSSLDSSKTGE